jgi:GNAT superfamily N-acetyltransferase
MAVELDRLREDVRCHETAAIRQAASLSDLEAFEDVQVAGWAGHRRRRDILAGLFGTLGWDHPDLAGLRPYIGWLGNEPVAAALCLRAAGAAGLYAVATVPTYRRQGLGAAITLHALREARADGYRVAVLYASKMGFPIYRRLGFQVYCDMEEYIWRGEAA